MMIRKPDNRGVSLAVTIGLLFMLVTLTATINQLVIRALRASHQIEASDKAYFAAEAGIEDALYELSAHTAGYKTPLLGEAQVRTYNFTKTVDWSNEWEITNSGANPCPALGAADVWNATFGPNYCGRLYENQKLVINLFRDTAIATQPTTNQVNILPASIETLGITNLTLRFRVPRKIKVDNGLTTLNIDNDGDLGASTEAGPEAILGLNEDGANSTKICPYSGGIAVNDFDCDAREDEDSPEDPVILWKLVDDEGRAFQPLRGCLTDPDHSSHIGFSNAVVCEKDFGELDGDLAVELNDQVAGLDTKDGPSGTIKTLADFFQNNYPLGSSRRLQMEITVIAPTHTVINVDKKIPIPYLEYAINFPAAIQADVPSTYFSIRSDGYYRDFKQSITTNVSPRTSSRLLDLTIIQQ